MLKVVDINKSFKDETVLKSISFTVNPKEVVHIKGGNGSGKSTLLKILTGIMEADSGSFVKEDGVVIGALIENPSFIENESALSNLKFLAGLNNKYDEQLVKDLFVYFDLNPDNKKPVKKYSVGMRQKVGIIQAIMENQNLIFFDEPTRGLDEESSNKFADLVVRLSDEGKSIVICAHDGVDHIDFTRVMVLKNGVLSDAHQ